MSNIIDKHAPVCTKKRVIRPSSPWFDNNIAREKRIKRQLERKWRHSRLTVHHQMYLAQKRKLKALIHNTKANYYNNKILECGKDQKALYKVMNGLLHREPRKNLPSGSPLELAKSFNEFFIAKIDRIRDNLPQPSENADVSSSSSNSPVVTLSDFGLVTTADVSTIINKSPTKSSAMDPIPSYLVKCCPDELVPVFTKIINQSIETSTFPASLKHAAITPLLKKSTLDPECLSNYRPVSNLTFLSKTLERVIAQRLQQHMSSNNLYEPMQSAYRSKHSVETATLRVHNDILTALDQGLVGILVMLDLSAAFDTVDHDVLISRLESLVGVTGKALLWFRSYLENRTQSVSISSVSSPCALLKCGVPQGSVLGPILFTVYTLPIGDIVRSFGLKLHVYADDTQIYTFCVSQPTTSYPASIQQIERCVEELSKWMAVNKLKLNNDKTELMVLQNQHKKALMRLPLQIGDHSICPTSVVRNLGVLFDAKMTMEAQVMNICKSCYFHLYNIRSIRSYITDDAASTLIHALITSKLDMGNAMLFGISESLCQKLQHVQNAAARLVTCTSRHDHVTPVLCELHWLPIRHRIMFKILLLVFKSLNNAAPYYISELITPYEPTRSLRSETSGQLSVPRTRLKTVGDRAFAAAAPHLWNNLPAFLRTPSTMPKTTAAFKSRLKAHLFSQAYGV